jgi:hypothetical protein
VENGLEDGLVNKRVSFIERFLLKQLFLPANRLEVTMASRAMAERRMVQSLVVVAGFPFTNHRFRAKS